MSDQQEDQGVQIENAPWWEANSFVLIKEDFLAADEAWVTNQITRVKGAKTKNPQVEVLSGNIRPLTVKRMVTGGVVSVKRSKERIYTVHLPGEVEKLLIRDLEYIAQEIDKLNPTMDEQEQEDFLASANGRFGESLQVVK